MALLICRVCGGKVASDADCCPHCGHKEQLKWLRDEPQRMEEESREKERRKEREQRDLKEYREKNNLCDICGGTCTVKEEFIETSYTANSFGYGDTVIPYSGKFKVFYCNNCGKRVKEECIEYSYRDLAYLKMSFVERLQFLELEKERAKQNEKDPFRKEHSKINSEIFTLWEDINKYLGTPEGKAYFQTPKGILETKILNEYRQKAKEELKKIEAKKELNNLKYSIGGIRGSIEYREYKRKHPYDYDISPWSCDTSDLDGLTLEELKLESKKASEELKKQVLIDEEKEKKDKEDFLRFENSAFNKAMRFLSNPWAYRP